MEQIKRKDIGIDIKWTARHAEIKGNEEADRLDKEASKKAESLTDEAKTVSQFKQEANAHSLLYGKNNGIYLRKEDFPMA